MLPYCWEKRNEVSWKTKASEKATVPSLSLRTTTLPNNVPTVGQMPSTTPRTGRYSIFGVPLYHSTIIGVLRESGVRGGEVLCGFPIFQGSTADNGKDIQLAIGLWEPLCTCVLRESQYLSTCDSETRW